MSRRIRAAAGPRVVWKRSRMPILYQVVRRSPPIQPVHDVGASGTLEAQLVMRRTDDEAPSDLWNRVDCAGGVGVE